MEFLQLLGQNMISGYPLEIKQTTICCLFNMFLGIIIYIQAWIACPTTVCGSEKKNIYLPLTSQKYFT